MTVDCLNSQELSKPTTSHGGLLLIFQVIKIGIFATEGVSPHELSSQKLMLLSFLTKSPIKNQVYKFLRSPLMHFLRARKTEPELIYNDHAREITHNCMPSYLVYYTIN